MDLYTLLGVPRNASADAIERAFRRLARRYHPGINPGDRQAEEMYRRIEEAYDVLGHLERRQQYDRGGSAPVATATVAFEGFDFSQPAEGPLAATFSELFADVFHEAARQVIAPSQGASIETTLRVSFEDAARGGAFPISVSRHDRCPSCKATGRLPRSAESCPACDGVGERRWARGHMVFAKACESCDGTGRLTWQACPSCGGLGVSPRSEVVTVTLPAGVEAGARVVVPGRGHAGAHGGPAGDLYVAIDVAEHRWFRRAGRDLHLTLPVAVHEAALGARVDVPTLDGRVKVKVPPGTSSGQRLRVRGAGIPANGDHESPGDLVVEIQIVLPPIADERSKELLREFARLNDVDVRAALFDDAGAGLRERR
jgi:molecular chaperone DnaJ